MATKKNKRNPKYLYLEQWDTRFGLSDRIVIREQGRFVDNITRKQLAGAKTVK
jgi:hypothetical protein